MRTGLIILLGATVFAMPTLAADPNPANCDIFTYPGATEVGEFYLTRSQTTHVELWRESNGVPGLQRQVSPCDGLDEIPRDTCIKHIENNAFIACLTGFPSTL